MVNIPVINLNGGVATPLIDARSDIEKYRSLCRKLENFFPRIYGVIERRPGTKFVKEAK
ncbi:hypothetical protein LCGC14_2892930 [marine sediment metagenome]|uniref:Uncharacterized protein n=1 Tax=marine sediment metagenome TaxID=412755 RepID=A0A0F8XX21_9ZZZZ